MTVLSRWMALTLRLIWNEGEIPGRFRAPPSGAQGRWNLPLGRINMKWSSNFKLIKLSDHWVLLSQIIILLFTIKKLWTMKIFTMKSKSKTWISTQITKYSHLPVPVEINSKSHSLSWKVDMQLLSVQAALWRSESSSTKKCSRLFKLKCRKSRLSDLLFSYFLTQTSPILPSLSLISSSWFRNIY